jgi:predicted NACHT family NTPase
MSPLEAIEQHCKQLRLSTINRTLPEALTEAQQQEWSLESFLLYLLEQEVTRRQERRIERYLRDARLPSGKTLTHFNQKRLPLRLRRQIPGLAQGDFINQSENILIFGQPGTGKTHLAAALAYEWIQRGYRVFFSPTFKHSNGSTAFKWLFLMILATSSKTGRKWRCSLPFWPNATNDVVWSLPPIWSSPNGTKSSKTR